MSPFIGSRRKHLRLLHKSDFSADTTPAMSDRRADYSAIVEAMKSRYSIRVKRWRKQMSGCAWSVRYSDGRCVNWIEAPLPKTPISLAIFLHEIGHHAIGFSRYKKRCEEEYHVWVWAIDQMGQLGIDPGEKVARRFQLSMQYAVGKAMRRGVKELPEPLFQFIPKAA